MISVQRSALVPYPATLMYGLVADVERYPEFLPWCSSARIDSADGAAVLATLEIYFRGLRQRFTTRNVGTPPAALTVELVQGPFRHLNGHWTFIPLAAGASKIEFSMQYEFRSAVLERLVGPVFGQIANTMVDAFVRRAGAVAGAAP